MNAEPPSAPMILDRMIDRLHERGRLRVWSLVITVFGDGVVPRGGQVPLSVLQELMARLRVEPGAVRTAMSRLAADHWVTRERGGRNSFYRLAEEGRHAFDLATRRIYAAGPPAWDGRWIVAVSPEGDGGRRGDRGRSLRALGFVPTGPTAWLKPHTEGADPLEDLPEDMLVIDGAAARIPDGVGRLWQLGSIADAYRDLRDELAPLAAALSRGEALAPLDAMAARVLVNHSWRRIVLRDPGLPEALLPADWPGEEARETVRIVYAALAGPSEAWLDRAGMPGQVKPALFAGRFGGLGPVPPG
ncbi:phenylacetic acid degradation protein [Aquibium oceanicum]|uniref:Phenylacetic acid degradation protein n=2 Tax=Aquibium oceanicum TaxID=1670800 RepID=A0A1L3SUK9_9HYPH|nr:phenylacetic acid degradation protein [Aquibium oceanicum]